MSSVIPLSLSVFFVLAVLSPGKTGLNGCAWSTIRSFGGSSEISRALLVEEDRIGEEVINRWFIASLVS